jgi:hypothetical protein
VDIFIIKKLGKLITVGIMMINPLCFDRFS